MRTHAALWLMGLLFASPLAAADESWRTPDKNWARGPVRWILTDDEEKAYKKLRTDEERAAFIKEFWDKRDPTPGTPQNEYMDVFWQRVESADKTFKSMIEAGSLTDLGRVFLLLGPPASNATDSRNRTIWTYEPDPVTGMTAHLELRFARTNTGQLLLDHKDIDEYVAAHPGTLGIGWTIPVVVHAEEPQVAAAEEHEEDLSPESQRQIPILEAIAAKGSGPADVTFQVTHDYYAAVDGSTLMVLTVEVPRLAAHGSGDAALLPFARLEPVAGEGRPFHLTGPMPFLPAPVSDCPPSSFIYQARRNLQPGAWKVTVVVEDRVVPGQMGAVVETITVPDYHERNFDMSSVALLAGFRPVDSGLGPDDDSHGAGPYMMGSFRMVPRASRTLLKSDALSFYYQVYNPARDPSSGKPSMEVTYTFYLKEAGEWKPFRRPIQKAQGQVELYSIAMKDLLRPDQMLPAEFKLEARLEDKIAGRALTRDFQFTVR